jgi:hypothetical protein
VRVFAFRFVTNGVVETHPMLFPTPSANLPWPCEVVWHVGGGFFPAPVRVAMEDRKARNDFLCWALLPRLCGLQKDENVGGRGSPRSNGCINTPLAPPNALFLSLSFIATGCERNQKNSPPPLPSSTAVLLPHPPSSPSLPFSPLPQMGSFGDSITLPEAAHPLRVSLLMAGFDKSKTWPAPRPERRNPSSRMRRKRAGTLRRRRPLAKPRTCPPPTRTNSGRSNPPRWCIARIGRQSAERRPTCPRT